MEDKVELLLNSVSYYSQTRIIFITSVITPLRASFFDQDDTTWVIIECTIDFIFTLDIVFTFCSAYYNKIE